jgi:hypothetical protein
MLTSNGRITDVLGALIIVVTDHGREVACPVYVVARVIGTYVVVFAYDALAEVLSADAIHTDAIDPVVDARRSVRKPRRVVTEPVHIVAIARAARFVVAVDAFAEVLSAHAVHTDAVHPVVRAAPAVGNRLARTTTTAAILPGAYVVVGRAHNATAGVTVPVEIVRSAPLYFFTTTEVHARKERNQHQHADAQESDQVPHDNHPGCGAVRP